VLQLAASQGQLSLQLQQPVTVGPLVLSQLVVSLPGLRFPVDLSGGVDRFRNRRGALEALTLQASLAALASHLAPRVRNVLGPEPCELVVLAAEHGLVFGLHEGPRALSFHAVFAPDDDTVRWVVTEARAVGLAVHSHGAALRAAEAMAGRHGSRTGSVVVFERGLQQLVREVLIDAGARAPETAAVRFSGWQETEGGWELEARRDAPVPALPAVVVRALETARIAERGDELLAAGELLEARAAYLSALEAAPRHPELSLRLAEADLLAQHGAENALALLIEAMPAVDGGNVAARLLAACGDRDGAMVATRRAADREPHGRHAALLLVEASEHASGLSERLSLLDEAAARSPGLLQARWARARARLEAGNVRGAAADLGDIEAGTRGSAKRYEACYAAGQLLLEGLAPAEAARFYQKALRYGPGSPEASVALARALLATGDGARAVALLSRAVGLARRTPAAPDVVLELARCLAGITQDLPTAIAHARSVPFGVPESIDARALEGRWRGALGDIAGASLCYA
jgi:tetratricopeptide (TPR) repeat protein